MKTKNGKSFGVKLISLLLIFTMTLPMMLFSIPTISTKATVNSGEGETDKLSNS